MIILEMKKNFETNFYSHEEQVKFQSNQLEKLFFENKEIPIVNQISTDHPRNDCQHPENLKLPKIEIRMFSGNPANWKVFI